MRLVVGSGKNRQEYDAIALVHLMAIKMKIEKLITRSGLMDEPDTVDRIIVEIELKP